jgi:hypothetical protein
MAPPEGVPTLVLPGDDDDGVVRVLSHLQELVLRHPAATQALFRAFVAEGRAFARTEEGRRWSEKLARSDLVRQGRVAWDGLTLNAFDDREETVLPTVILEAFAKAIASTDLHAVLAEVLELGLLSQTEDRRAG